MANPLWDVRDNRTLSSHAKLAYLMLLSRQPDIRPSMRLLAADMRVSESTAIRAVRELKTAGVLKVVPQMTNVGDADTNRYELLPVDQIGGVVSHRHHPSVPQTPGVVSDRHPKGSRASDQQKEERVSRRAREASFTSADKIAVVREAVIWTYGSDDCKALSDEDALGIHARFIGDRTDVAKPFNFLTRIFEDDFPYLEGVLASSRRQP